MNIIFCFHHTYKYLEDYILSILPVINAKLEIYNSYSLNISFEKQNKYIFVSGVPYNLLSKITDFNVYLIATEQLCNPKKLKELYNSSNEKLNIIDYSLYNLQYYDSIRYNKKFFLPYQINYNEIMNTKKTSDVCLIGDIVPPNRQYIIDALKTKNINVDIIGGFGKSRDEQLFKYKIILNIGYFDYYKVFEHIRCDRCVYNKMIVISDMKNYMEGIYLQDYIIFESYDNIPNKVSEVLNNYDNYYNKIFSNFNFETISKTITHLSKDVIAELC
jgi:hypothetical protein